MERPILFNTEMVKAILEGKKTSTRRPIKRTPCNDEPSGYGFWEEYNERDKRWYVKDYNHSPTWWTLEEYISKFSRYHIGDILWVRETWLVDSVNDVNKNMAIDFKAIQDGYHGAEVLCDFKPDRYKKFRKFYQKKGWQSSLFMPREAARLFLKVTDVRVETIRATTAGDCAKEGIKLDYPITDMQSADEYIYEFRKLWDKLYKNWNENPWVWVIEFKIERR